MKVLGVQYSPEPEGKLGDENGLLTSHDPNGYKE